MNILRLHHETRKNNTFPWEWDIGVEYCSLNLLENIKILTLNTLHLTLKSSE